MRRRDAQDQAQARPRANGEQGRQRRGQDLPPLSPRPVHLRLAVSLLARRFGRDFPVPACAQEVQGQGQGQGTGTGKGQGPGQVKRASRQRRHLGNATPPRSKAGTAGKGAPVKARVRNNNNAFPNASVCGKANNGARTCLHYRRGWCAYGEACRFTHPQEKEDAAAAVAAFAAAKAADDGSGLQLVLRLPSELWMEVLCFHSLLELVTTTICKVRGARGERGGGGAVCGVWHWLCVYWCSQGSPGQLGEQFHYQWTQ